MFKKIKAYFSYLKDEREQQKEFSIYHNNKLNLCIYFILIIIGPLLYYFFPTYILAWTFGYLSAIVMSDILDRRL